MPRHPQHGPVQPHPTDDLELQAGDRVVLSLWVLVEGARMEAGSTGTVTGIKPGGEAWYCPPVLVQVRFDDGRVDGWRGSGAFSMTSEVLAPEVP